MKWDAVMSKRKEGIGWKTNGKVLRKSEVKMEARTNRWKNEKQTERK